MADWQRKFYKSKQWKLMRAYIIGRDKGVCRFCGEVVVGSPEVHHTVELTEFNNNDPSVSLNPDLLETLHHECHDARHGRFGCAEKESIVGDDLNIDYSRR